MAHALHWANLLSGSINIFLIILTVISDILMVVLIRNLRRTQPIQLVPWKSTKIEENKKDDISVPVRATSISLIITAITVATVIVFTGWNQSIVKHWTFYILMLIVKMVVYPCILVFTIKNSKNKKPTPVIPNRPMFHDSDLDKGM